MRQAIKRAVRTLAALAVLGASYLGTTSEAEAGSASSTFTVSTTVQQACTFSASDITIPAYTTGPGSVDVVGSADFGIDCGGLPVDVSMTMTPLSGTATGTVWNMDGPSGSVLAYAICEDSVCSVPFASGVANAFTQAGGDSTKTIYARASAGQTLTPGLHTQTVQADIVY